MRPLFFCESPAHPAHRLFLLPPKAVSLTWVQTEGDKSDRPYSNSDIIPHQIPTSESYQLFQIKLWFSFQLGPDYAKAVWTLIEIKIVKLCLSKDTL